MIVKSLNMTGLIQVTMDNKKLGVILIGISLILGLIILSYNSMLETQAEASCNCLQMEDGFCPHKEHTPWQAYAGMIVLSGMGALGIYLVFFEKSQKAVIAALQKQRQLKLEEEKFNILMKGITHEEKLVMKAVKEQDGITQQTLRLRTGLHKSKLSIVL